MNSLKNHTDLKKIKDIIHTTSHLDKTQKSNSVKIMQEWLLEDKAFGILREELLKVSLFFEGVFSELGIK